MDKEAQLTAWAAARSTYWSAYAWSYVRTWSQNWNSAVDSRWRFDKRRLRGPSRFHIFAAGGSNEWWRCDGSNSEGAWSSRGLRCSPILRKASDAYRQNSRTESILSSERSHYRADRIEGARGESGSRLLSTFRPCQGESDYRRLYGISLERVREGIRRGMEQEKEKQTVFVW